MGVMHIPLLYFQNYLMFHFFYKVHKYSDYLRSSYLRSSNWIKSLEHTTCTCPSHLLLWKGRHQWEMPGQRPEHGLWVRQAAFCGGFGTQSGD